MILCGEQPRQSLPLTRTPLHFFVSSPPLHHEI
jgi:hypothetical protein